MTYSLGATSRRNLQGVHPRLVQIVERAIALTTQDFTVNEGLRTRARQTTLVAQGFSKTMNSQHIPQPDGKGHAVDLVPWVQGHPVWDWEGCYKVAMAMDAAATEYGWARNIRWGGAWDKRLSDFGGDAAAYKREVAAYQARHAGPDFLDGPHFEWRDD
jgi:peptidoglycan L-alanyl-D-glutamate endopeptidase CwlK